MMSSRGGVNYGSSNKPQSYGSTIFEDLDSTFDLQDDDDLGMNFDLQDDMDLQNETQPDKKEMGAIGNKAQSAFAFTPRKIQTNANPSKAYPFQNRSMNYPPIDSKTNGSNSNNNFNSTSPNFSSFRPASEVITAIRIPKKRSTEYIFDDDDFLSDVSVSKPIDRNNTFANKQYPSDNNSLAKRLKLTTGSEVVGSKPNVTGSPASDELSQELDRFEASLNEDNGATASG